MIDCLWEMKKPGIAFSKRKEFCLVSLHSLIRASSAGHGPCTQALPLASSSGGVGPPASRAPSLEKFRERSNRKYNGRFGSLHVGICKT